MVTILHITTTTTILLLQYVTPLVLLLLLQVGVLVMLPAVKNMVYTTMTWVGRILLSSYMGEVGELNLVTAVVDRVMGGLECCGVHNYSDFNNYRQWHTTKLHMQVNIVGTYSYYNYQLYCED